MKSIVLNGYKFCPSEYLEFTKKCCTLYFKKMLVALSKKISKMIRFRKKTHENIDIIISTGNVGRNKNIIM